MCNISKRTRDAKSAVAHVNGVGVTHPSEVYVASIVPTLDAWFRTVFAIGPCAPCLHCTTVVLGMLCMWLID